MKSKKIFLLLGHPNPDKNTLSGILADAYESAAIAAGHEVRRMNVSDITFDPILHKGYLVIQEYEEDLKKFQEHTNWCEHFVLFYPNWWGSMPALLKGMWDRVFMPRFAFRMWKNRLGWDALLKGRTARVVITCGNPVILDHLAFGDFTDTIKRSILQFAGFRTWVTAVGSSEHLSDAAKASWVRRISALARKAR